MASVGYLSRFVTHPDFAALVHPLCAGRKRVKKYPGLFQISSPETQSITSLQEKRSKIVHFFERRENIKVLLIKALSVYGCLGLFRFLSVCLGSV